MSFLQVHTIILTNMYCNTIMVNYTTAQNVETISKHVQKISLRNWMGKHSVYVHPLFIQKHVFNS